MIPASGFITDVKFMTSNYTFWIYCQTLRRQKFWKRMRTSKCRRGACSICSPLTKLLSVRFLNKLRNDDQFYLEADRPSNDRKSVYSLTVWTFPHLQQCWTEPSNEILFAVYRATYVFIHIWILHCNSDTHVPTSVYFELIRVLIHGRE